MAADKGKREWMLPGVLLTIHIGLLAYSAWAHSPTFNEPAHLAAGMSHWQFGRFELYRVNPPLVRMLAALPVLAAGAKTDWAPSRKVPATPPPDDRISNVISKKERTTSTTSIGVARS